MCRGSSNPDGAAVVSVQYRIFGERVQVFSESVQINQGKCPFIGCLLSYPALYIALWCGYHSLFLILDTFVYACIIPSVINEHVPKGAA